MPSEYDCTHTISQKGVSGCLLDTLFQLDTLFKFWKPYFICHLHVTVL